MRGHRPERPRWADFWVRGGPAAPRPGVGLRRASCFEGRVLVFPSRGGRVARDGCEDQGVSFEVGTPLPRAGEARRPLAATAPLRLRDAERLRSRGRWQELRRGEPLGLGDTKQPDGPAGLHGGCTEPGLIRGTRPSSKLMTGSGREAPAGRGAARPCSRGPRPHGAGGAGRARGAGRRLGPASACVSAWVLHLWPKWRSSERGGGEGGPLASPPPRQPPQGGC